MDNLLFENLNKLGMAVLVGGLTMAATIWLPAALGMGIGGGELVFPPPGVLDQPHSQGAFLHAQRQGYLGICLVAPDDFVYKRLRAGAFYIIWVRYFRLHRWTYRFRPLYW